MTFIKKKSVVVAIIIFLIALGVLLVSSFIARIIGSGDHSVTILILKSMLICIPVIYLIAILLTWKPFNRSGKAVSIVLFLLFTYFSAILFLHFNSYEIITVTVPVSEIVEQHGEMNHNIKLQSAIMMNR